MKFNTRIHAVMDYLTAGLLMLPYIVNYDANSADSLVLASMGLLLLVYSVLSDYELGLLKWIPLKVHYALDIILGIFLILTPWLFDLYNYYRYWPELIGAAMILLVVFSSGKAYRITRRDLDITRPGS